MANLLAIVSKAQFEALAKSPKPGDVLGLDRYTSANKALALLAEGGTLFLVTVRPPNEALWLVGALESPKHDGAAWRAAPSRLPIRDISSLKSELRFSSGTGIQAKPGALGMSLQTPRQLTDADVSLLRGTGDATSARSKPAPSRAEATPPPARASKKSAAKVATGSVTAAPKKKKPAVPTAKREPPPSPPPAEDEPLGDYVEEAPRVWSAEMRKLWQEVLAAPDDLTARTVLADKLQEIGDPYGEYLQLGCELATLGDDDPRRSALEDRLETLRCRHIHAFTRTARAVEALFPDGKVQPGALGFRRGCIERLRLTPAQVSALPAISAVVPIRELDVEGDRRPSWGAELAAMPELARIRRLDVRFDDVASALSLLNSKRLARVEALSLSAPMSDELLAAIAAQPAFSELKELSLDAGGTDAELGPRIAHALAKLPLVRFSGSRLGLGPEGADALARAWPLEELRIAYDAIGPRGGRALAESAALAGLRVLKLESCELGEKGCAALASSPRLASLRTLELHYANGFNAKAMASMAAGWALPALRRLHLSGPLRAEGAALLAGIGGLAALEELTLHDAALKEEGAAALARWATPGSLRHVALFGCGLDEAALRVLAAGQFLAPVRSLDIARNKCGAEGGKALAEAPCVPHLETLRLHYNWMGVGGVRALLERMPQARKLVLGENNYGAEPMKIAARGILPRLRTLRLGTEGDKTSLERWMKSGHARRLRALSLRQTHVSAAAAAELARLPELVELYFSFCSYDPGVVEALRARFPGTASFWPDN